MFASDVTGYAQAMQHCTHQMLRAMQHRYLMRSLSGSAWWPRCPRLTSYLDSTRRLLAFEPGCAALVSSPVSQDVNASKHRLPLANSTGRTTLLGTALMDAGCSALLAAAEAKAGFASGGALLALTPRWAARPLARSLVPSARTACRSSAINVARGRLFCRAFCCTPHAEHRGQTYSLLGLGFFASTGTAARNRRSSGELDSSPCAFSHTVSALMEVKGSAGCSKLLGT